MAERRMFAKTIVLSDAFLDMPLSARCLYFTLGMLADDDGFVNSPKSIMRQCGASQDDMTILLNKRFLLPFESGVVVIKHWRINNYLRSDRHTDTKYIAEKEQLVINDNGAYSLQQSVDFGIPNGVIGIPPGIPPGIPSIDKDSIYNSTSNEVLCPTSAKLDPPKTTHQDIIEAWNELKEYGISPLRVIPTGSNRARLLAARINQFGKDAIFEAIEQVKQSDFLLGRTKRSGEHRNWRLTFDWFIAPSNFPKVLEGQYSNNSGNTYQSRTNREEGPE